jgi:hypothetical protein
MRNEGVDSSFCVSMKNSLVIQEYVLSKEISDGILACGGLLVGNCHAAASPYISPHYKSKTQNQRISTNQRTLNKPSTFLLKYFSLILS